MLLTVLSVIIFFVTLPVKAVKLGVDTSRRASALKDRLHSTLYENRQEKSTEEKLDDAKQGAKRTGKAAIRLIKKSIITLLRFIRIVATILFSIGLLWSLILVMVVLLFTSTAGYMLAMQQYGIDVSSLAANANTSAEKEDDEDGENATNKATVVAGSETKEEIMALKTNAEIWSLISDGQWKSFDEAQAACRSTWQSDKYSAARVYSATTDKTYNFWKSSLVSVEVPCWKWENGKKVSSTCKISVNKHLANYFTAYMTDLYNLPEKYCIAEIGGFSYRLKASGSGSMSGHAFGCVLDINWNRKGMGYKEIPYSEKTWKTLSEEEQSYICYAGSDWEALAKEYRLDWGGHWSSGSVDPMHFSLVGDNNGTEIANRNYTCKTTQR